MDTTLVEPYVPIEEKLNDAFLKGYISRDDADRLQRTVDHVLGSFDTLADEYPDRVVAVVESDEGDFRTLPAADHLAAEARAANFFPETPYVIAGFGTEAIPIGDGEAVPVADDEDPFDIVNGSPVVTGSWTDTSGETTKEKTYLIDTGANESMISLANVVGTDIRIVGVVVARTAGGTVQMLKIGGSTMTFPVEPKGGGKPTDTDCDVPVALGSIDILGTDQLRATGTVLIFDPAGDTVRLERRTGEGGEDDGNGNADGDDGNGSGEDGGE